MQNTITLYLRLASVTFVILFIKAMSTEITQFLKDTARDLLCKAVPAGIKSVVAKKLKDGDLTDEEARQMIVGDLSKIKSKLDGLSLKDLHSSLSSFNEGIRLLSSALDKSNADQTMIANSIDEVPTVSNNAASTRILSEAVSLRHAFERLKITSKEQLVPAEACFRRSRESATDAFNNQSLTIKDRIMACKVRVTARYLESGYADPKTATTACMFYLEELHNLPAVQEMLSVLLHGGLRSMRNQEERFENIMSVLLTNHVMIYFESKYGSEYPNIFKWPKIQLADRAFHPILHAQEILTKSSSSIQLNRVALDMKISESEGFFAVNSRREIILFNDNIITVIRKNGERERVELSKPTPRGKFISQERRAITVDSTDNVYALTWLTTEDENGPKGQNVLHVLDEHYIEKHVSVLDFPTSVNIAVDSNRNLRVIARLDKNVYLCDDKGQVKSHFERAGDSLRSLDALGNGDVMIESEDCHTVHIYGTEGELKSTLKVPEGHQVCQVAFYHGICKSVVLTYVKEQISWFLLCFSENGEIEKSVFVLKKDPEQSSWAVDMKSHPSGLLAVLCNNSVTWV